MLIQRNRQSKKSAGVSTRRTPFRRAGLGRPGPVRPRSKGRAASLNCSRGRGPLAPIGDRSTSPATSPIEFRRPSFGLFRIPGITGAGPVRKLNIHDAKNQQPRPPAVEFLGWDSAHARSARTKIAEPSQTLPQLSPTKIKRPRRRAQYGATEPNGNRPPAAWKCLPAEQFDFAGAPRSRRSFSRSWPPAARVGMCRESIRPASTSSSFRTNRPQPPLSGHLRRQERLSHRHSSRGPPRRPLSSYLRRPSETSKPRPSIQIPPYPHRSPLPRQSSGRPSAGRHPTSVIGPPLVAVPIPQDRVIISPERVMAPIGSEVVLRAGICSARGFLLADRRVEWLLAKEGRGRSSI